jgi:hypothetical protein
MNIVLLHRIGLQLTSQSLPAIDEIRFQIRKIVQILKGAFQQLFLGVARNVTKPLVDLEPKTVECDP